MWGVHIHRCRRKHGPSLTCTKWQSPLTNTHILGGRRVTSKFRTQRHNSTFTLLHKLLKIWWRKKARSRCRLGPKTNHWLRKSTSNAHADDQFEAQLQAIAHPSQEGLRDDKHDHHNHPQIIPDYILHPQQRTKHPRPDLVRAVGYTKNSERRLIVDPTYRWKRQIQSVECKYSTDGNIQEIIVHINQLYEPLKTVLQTHGRLKADVTILPIFISRTCTFNVKTLAEIDQLVSYKEEPPDIMTYKQLP